MPKNVLCEVNNCNYWGEGNLCEANEIYVVVQKGNQAKNSDETDCKTFEPNSFQS